MRIQMLILAGLILTGCSGSDTSEHANAAPVAASLSTSLASPEEFVRAFYDWYTSVALEDQPIPAWNAVIEHRASTLSPELFRGLKDSADAQAKAEGEIAGLDFDPFLNSQDPCERYEVGTASQVGRGYRVDVHSVCSGIRSQQPDVVAEVAVRNGSLVLVNFHYPREQTDLQTLLMRLREDRR